MSRRLKRRTLAATLTAFALPAGAPTADASVTIGQIAPDAAAPRMCTSPFDRLQPTVTGGNSYVMPATGTITSWSTYISADGAAGQLKLKVFRPVAGTVYTAVAHDGPRDLAADTINMFPTSVPVKAGDLLGLNSFSGSPDCAFLVAGESYPRAAGDVADGDSASFTDSTVDRRLNVSAVLEPSNALTFGPVARNKKKGTATLTVDAPNPGQLATSGSGLKLAQKSTVVTVSAPGPIKFKLQARGTKLATLNETGKVKVTPTFTFTPTGGTAKATKTKIKLKKRT